MVATNNAEWENHEDNYELYTINYLIDALKKHLATFEQPIEIKKNEDKKKIFDSRKYYDQAHHLLKIGAFKPTPSFIVYLSDLTRKLIKELSNLDSETRDYVLRQAVGRIFEDVNSDLHHNSISRVLKVKLEK